MAKETPWLEIKADYLKQIPPRELAKKYKVKAKAISDKANEEGWKEEKTKISENVRINVEEEITEGTNEAVKYLREVVNNEDETTKDRIAAAKGLLDVSGLKSLKQEVTGKDGAPLATQKIYITPQMQAEADKIIDKWTEND